MGRRTVKPTDQCWKCHQLRGPKLPMVPTIYYDKPVWRCVDTEACLREAKAIGRDGVNAAIELLLEQR